MKVTVKARKFVHSITLVTLGSLTTLSVTALNANAVTINRNFVAPPNNFFLGPFDLGPASAPPTLAGGGNLIDVFNAAADSWELAILDDRTLNIDFGWADLAGPTLGVIPFTHV